MRHYQFFGVVIALLVLAAHPPRLAVAAAGVTVDAAPIPAAAAADGPEVAPLTAIELALFRLTNADRGRNGLAPALLDPSLLGIARARAAAQLTQDRLSHYDATGELAVASLLAESGVNYLLAGENLARSASDGSSVADSVEQALMGSPVHRKNILEPSFNRLAVGAVADSSGRLAFAEIFRAAP